MKSYFIWFGLLLLSIAFTINPMVSAQSDSRKAGDKYKCNLQPLGQFRQITGASVALSRDYVETYEVIQESDIAENRWKLGALDEVDPAYQIYLVRNPKYSGKENCDALMDVVGKLIAPTGKVFDLERSTYDVPNRKLKFSTVERDRIKYDGEAQYYGNSKFVKGEEYHIGYTKLKATIKDVGVVLIEFPFTKWSSD